MNHKWLAYFLFLGLGFVSPVRAQLQFTNITNPRIPNNLYGVTCGGVSNSVAGGSNNVFVAVGEGSAVATLTFSNLSSSASQNTDWTLTHVPGTNFAWYTTAFGGSNFLVSGTNNVVFSSTDGYIWKTNGTIFPNSATAQGLAFNENTFVAVASAPEISWAANSSPLAWSNANFQELSFGDSYRGVTALKLSSPSPTNTYFAACGVLGRLAISANAGQYWLTPYPNGQPNLPDLQGIASDGNNTLVSVGAVEGRTTASILTFTVTNNSGAAGLVANISATNVVTLNAVSYIGTNYLGTNYGFLAVGAGGSVLLISSNGTSSANITASTGNSNNLNGVFFATSGIYKGIGVLVGAKGSIILAGTPPPPPTNPIDSTNSANWPLTPATNSPLSVMLVTNDFYPAGTLTVDWYANAVVTPGEMAVTNGSISFYPTNNPNLVGSNTNFVLSYYAQARDIRTGFVNTNRVKATITIYPRPTSVTGGRNEICSGMGTTLTNVLTGIGPWTVDWTNGVTNVIQQVNLNMPGPYTNMLALNSSIPGLTNSNPNQAITNDFWVAEVISSNLNNFVCTSFASDLMGTNEVVIDPRPTSTTGGTNEICNGMVVTLTNVLSGLGPWTVFWTNGSASYVQAVTNDVAGYYTNTLALTSGMFGQTNSNPDQATTNYYWVAQVVSSNLLDGYLCTNLASDLAGTNVVVIDPRPTSTTGGTNEICNGMPVTLTNVLTGIGPWTVYWTNNSSASLVQNVTNLVVGMNYTNTLPLTSGMFGQTNSNPNQAITIAYWVAEVVSSNAQDGFLCTNSAGDLTGTNLVIIDPRPTSTAVTTNQIGNGMSTTVTNVLTGLGPWTVYWTDNRGVGYVQSVTNNVPGYYTNTLSLPNAAFTVTNLNANQATNYYFWVTQLVSSNRLDGYLCTNLASDLGGTNEVIVDPLPTSTSVSTNEVCNGMGTTVTNVLTGIGPWTVYWTNGSAGYVQSVTNSESGMNYTNTLSLPVSGFVLTDLFPNQSTNYYFWVAQVVSSNLVGGVLCTNGVGGVEGTNLVTVDPRPTSTAVTTNQIGNGMSTTVTNVLTGLGPWTVYWTDNRGVGYVQSVTNNVPGYYTNTLSLPNAAFTVTNLNANQATNYYFWVTQLVSSNRLDGYLCTNLASDLGGTNEVIVDSLPTSTSISTNEVCNGMSTTVTNVLTGIGPWTVYWTNGSAGYVQSVTNSGSGMNYTNTLSLPVSGFVLTDLFTNQSTNYYFWVAQVVSSNLVGGVLYTNGVGGVKGTNLVTVDPLPASMTGGTNEICSGMDVTLTNVLSGIGPWTVTWTDGTTNYVEYITNSVPGYYTDTFYLTNSVFNIMNVGLQAVTNHYWVTQVVSSNLLDGYSCTNSASGLSATNELVIDPVLQTPPTNSGDVTSCSDVPVPLSVSVPQGFTADWYSGMNLVAAGTNLYVPPAPVNLGGNASVTNTFMVMSRFIDPNRTNCYSPATSVSLISVACTNAIASITLSGNSVVLQWTGNYVLESTTNLVPPNLALSPWVVVTNSGVGANYWTNSITSPPVNFYRLTTQTN